MQLHRGRASRRRTTTEGSNERPDSLAPTLGAKLLWAYPVAAGAGSPRKTGGGALSKESNRCASLSAVGSASTIIPKGDLDTSWRAVRPPCVPLSLEGPRRKALRGPLGRQRARGAARAQGLRLVSSGGRQKKHVLQRCCVRAHGQRGENRSKAGCGGGSVNQAHSTCIRQPRCVSAFNNALGVVRLE